MSHHDEYPDEIVVDWCVTARVRGKGKPMVHTTMGGSVEATGLMAEWLDGIEIDGDKVQIKITAELTSEQAPDGLEKKTYLVKGLSVASSIAYAKRWLNANGALPGWGSGP